jgi:hypothetical protein
VLEEEDEGKVGVWEDGNCVRGQIVLNARLLVSFAAKDEALSMRTERAAALIISRFQCPTWRGSMNISAAFSAHREALFSFVEAVESPSSK